MVDKRAMLFVDAQNLEQTAKYHSDEAHVVDIGLATELLAQGFNDSSDVAVIASGDADFDRAVRYVQDQGKVVEAAMFEEATSPRLRDAVDDFSPLDEYEDRLYRGDGD